METGVGDASTTPTQVVGETPKLTQSVLLVRFYADQLNDLEDMRKRVDNRLRSLTRDDEWGHGIPEWHPDIQPALIAQQQITAFEQAAILNLKRAFRLLPPPLVTFVKNTVGLGEKTAARFIGTVGGLAWHPREERPRTLGELYAYCGLHVVNGEAPRRRKGVQANYNIQARTRAYIMAVSCIKLIGSEKRQRSPYRDVYDDTRAHYADATHEHQCGCKAPIGSPLCDGRAHARATRAVMKAIVADLWHQSQIPSETHRPPGSVSQVSTNNRNPER